MTDQQTMSRATRYRKQRQQGVEWFPPSDPDMPIRVRKLTITDHAVINQFPDNLQKVIFDQIEGDGVLRGEPEEPKGLFGGMNGKQLLETQRDLSVRMAKLGWIEPRLVDEVTDPEHEIGVDEVEDADLVAYMTWVFSGHQTEARQVATFPDRPQGGVGPRSAEPAVLAATERHTGAPGGGILRSDAV